MKRLFEGFGQVEEVFVPLKLDKWGRKFGFVKFWEVEDLDDLESRLEEVWLWKVRLKVNKARFGRENQKVDGESASGTAVKRGGGAVVPTASRKEEFAWDKSQFPVLQKVTPTLSIQPSEIMLEYLDRSFVAELHHNL